MPRRSGPLNPFYLLVVAAGVAFVLTVIPFWLMMRRDLTPRPPGPAGRVDPAWQVANADRGLLGFLDRHGTTLLTLELAVLGLATLGAIATDDFWARRYNRRLAARGREAGPPDPTAVDSRASAPSLDPPPASTEETP